MKTPAVVSGGRYFESSNNMTDKRFLADGEEQSSGPISILRTFVLHSKVKVLSGLAALSYVAGREGDDEWAWAAEAEDALIDAFFVQHGDTRPNGPRFERYLTAKATLAAAFRGGHAQREIDLALTGRVRTFEQETSPRQMVAKVCDRAIALARAHATIYADEIDIASDRHPHAIESAIRYVSIKVAQRHAVTDAEAAYCALKAFEDLGLDADWEAAAVAMEGAAAGRADREAEEENARERAAEVSKATASLFDGVE
ncbi:hypothetical protein SH584_08765 [Sphingomonas sp. LY29]|uniref:hypothetical protein n=1 Tax=Sphingomonas sp. LY29 TaxID=3095341 RepID=UPI002D77C733|nr:hypothetical protein [Sphingomonas sp. LY29]WRP25139.1 hypothetical protein SH584_08765 [Sphingomonas sp. LY29]